MIGAFGVENGHLEALLSEDVDDSIRDEEMGVSELPNVSHSGDMQATEMKKEPKMRSEPRRVHPPDPLLPIAGHTPYASRMRWHVFHRGEGKEEFEFV